MRIRHIAAALTLALAACSSDATDTGLEYEDFLPWGTYSLESVGGAVLPVTMGASVLTAGRYRLNDDGTFSASLFVRPAAGGDVWEDRYAGTWTGNPVAFVLTYNDTGAQETGSVSDDVFTLSSGGMMWVFRKDRP